MVREIEASHAAGQGNDDSFFKAENINSQKIIEKLQNSISDETKKQQVDIRMVKTDWLAKGSGFKLLKNLVKYEECFEMFKSQTLQDVINFLWDHHSGYFIYWYFTPFLMLNFVPLVVMSFMILKIESDNYGYWCFVVYGVCNLMFALGTLISIIAEIREMRAKSMRKYWS